MRHCAIDTSAALTDGLGMVTRSRLKQRLANPPEQEPLTVAVCIDTRDGPGRERLRGVYHHALKQNWRLILMRHEGLTAERQLAAIPLNGAILYDRTEALHRFFLKQEVPCVETGSRNLKLSTGAVSTDDVSLGRLAAEHFVKAGLRHFAHCGLVATFPSRQRAKYFSQFLKPHGGTAETFEDAMADGEAAMDSMIRWLQKLPKPVGVFAYDDKMAERVLAACRWSGIAVPDEVSVLGIGNDELICELAHPKLSSISVPAWEIGQKAAELLDPLMQGRPLAERFWHIHPTEVVTRASSDWLPPAHPSVKAATEIIRASFHQPIGTDQIASAVGVARRTLERRFMTGLKKTVHEYLTGLRLRHAKQLLQQPGLRLGDIARRCGYVSLSSFTTMFRSEVGCHPRDYGKRESTEKVR
jgi:LacI family transcriptional regulator